jgi:hypothetical protein
MRKSILVTLVVVFGGFVYAGSETVLRTDEPDLKTCERALELLGKGERSGFELLLDQSPDKGDDQKSRWIDSQAGLLRGHVQSLGKPYGFEQVGATEVGRSLRKYTYMCKYEHGRVYWRFTFYRGADDWRFEGYVFDGNDNAAITESGHNLPLSDRSESIAEKRQGVSR